MIDKVIIQGSFNQFNYLQTDEDFEILWDRINLQLYKDRKTIHFVLPVSILSISCLQNIINLTLGLRKLYSKDKQLVDLSFTHTDVPNFLNINLLPPKYLDMLEYTWSFMVSKLAQEETPYAGFTHLEISKLEYYINYMQTESKHTPSEQKALQQKFYKHVRDYDFTNNKNFCAIFPDMKDYFNLCKKLYDEQQVN